MCVKLTLHLLLPPNLHLYYWADAEVLYSLQIVLTGMNVALMQDTTIVTRHPLTKLHPIKCCNALEIQISEFCNWFDSILCVILASFNCEFDVYYSIIHKISFSVLTRGGQIADEFYSCVNTFSIFIV